MTGFIRQEGMHARVHKEAQKYLTRHGIETDTYLNRVDNLFSKILGDKPLGIGQGLLRSVVAVRRQICNHWRTLHGTAYSSRVVQHHIHCHARRVRQTEHDHAQGISHEEQIHAGFIKQTRGRVIVGRQYSDRLSLDFTLGELRQTGKHGK